MRTNGAGRDDLRFDFGRNWQSYLDRAFDDAREETVRRSLVCLTGLADFHGRAFIDIGCGSGVFSLAAHRLGASVVSLDLDPLSVECCRRVRASAGSPDTWRVLEGSILDPAIVKQLSPSDIVYSWGVLHHTGQMWTALRAAAVLLAPGGLLCVALYNKVESRLTGSDSWLRIKRFYVSSGRTAQAIMKLGYGAYKTATLIATIHNPVTVARAYRQQRGMSLWHDWVDWLGGYPYEYASAGEVFRFGQEELGLQLIRLNTTSTIGCNEFVFFRPATVASSTTPV